MQLNLINFCALLKYFCSLQDKIKQKRAEREAEEKQKNLDLEKKRREMGKDMQLAKEK